MGTYTTTTALAILMVGTKFDSATTALCDKLITHAENEVNKYLVSRYDITALLAMSPIPPVVTSLTETLCEGFMYQRMSRGGKEAMTRAKMLIDQATSELADIKEYKLNVVDSAGDALADNAFTDYRVASTSDQYSNTFNEDDALNWAVDRNKIQDIEDERND